MFQTEDKHPYHEYFDTDTSQIDELPQRESKPKGDRQEMKVLQPGDCFLPVKL